MTVDGWAWGIYPQRPGTRPKITVTAERRIVKELVQDIRAVRGKHGLLYQLADAALAHPDETVREAVYPVVDQDTLEAIVKEYQAKGPGYQRRIQTSIHNAYKSHYRRMLPLILEALVFRSNNEQYRPVPANPHHPICN